MRKTNRRKMLKQHAYLINFAKYYIMLKLEGLPEVLCWLINVKQDNISSKEKKLVSSGQKETHFNTLTNLTLLTSNLIFCGP